MLVGHPLDTIKVRLQTASSSQGLSMASCVRLTLREEGVRGFYKGMQSPLAGEGFFNAVQFLVYGASKRMLLERTEGLGVPASLPAPLSAPGGPRIATARSELSIPEYFMAGAITGFACTFVETPIDLFKSQLQTQIFRASPAFTTFPQCVGYIWRASRIRGCFQGMTATFLRTVPASACYFGTYEAAKAAMLAPGQLKADLGPLQLLGAGGCGGVAYWLSSFPADSVKSAMQSDAVHRKDRQYASTLDCIGQMWREGGVRRFYRGLAPCLIRSFPANAACFFAYEKALAWLQTV